MIFAAYYRVKLEKWQELVDFAVEYYSKNGPPEDIKRICDYGSPDGRGIEIVESDSAEAVFRYFATVYPFLESIEIFPIVPAERAMTIFGTTSHKKHE